MPWFKQQSDEKLIENLRRDERYRRWLGFVQAAFGLAFMAMVGAMTTRLYRDWTDPKTPLPMDRQSFVLGMIIGGFVGGTMFKVGHLAAKGLVRAFLPSARDRMLLRLWAERHPGTNSDTNAAPPASVRSETTYAEYPPAYRFT